MKKSLTIFLLFAFLFLNLSFARGQSAADWQAFDAFVNKTLADWEVPGAALAIVKDDKIIYAKGYGIKELTSSPAMTYRRLYYAVKAKNTEAIKREMSAATLKFAEGAAKQQNKPVEKILENGFYASTMAATLPGIRDERVKNNFGAIEVWNEREKLWEDVSFVKENDDWKLAVGEIFQGTYKSPGKSFSDIERENNPPPNQGIPLPGEKKRLNSSVPVRKQTLKPPPNIILPTIDEHTLFAVASNSKAFTATALAMLADEGKINWDDKVTKHLPDFRLADDYVTREITIRDLLSHRSGLPAYGGDILWWGGDYGRDDIVRRVRFVKPAYSFRSTYAYQNIPFIIAGQIIEKVSGKTWDEFVKTRILQPLAMSETTTSIRDFAPDANKTMPHFRDLETGKTFAIRWRNLDNGAAAAGINSNVLDMANWLRLQLNEGEFEGRRLVSPKNIREIQSPQTIIPFTNQSPEPKLKTNFRAYGLGWSLREYAGYKMVTHGGWADGQLSTTAMIPEKRVGVVVLTNVHHQNVSTPLAYRALDIALGLSETDWNAYFFKFIKDAENDFIAGEKKLEADRIKNTKPGLALKDYAGNYENELYGRITFTEENGSLVVRLSHSPTYIGDLRHWENDKFRVVWRDPVAEKTFLTFTVKNGRVEAVKMAMAGFIDDAEYEYFKR
ncbi:MAG TPA: serine hydrolase [Pyrinomonadaceae bacterium]|jgi:CubicO group peptidase (beta-lactamase class C family)